MPCSRIISWAAVGIFWQIIAGPFEQVTPVKHAVVLYFTAYLNFKRFTNWHHLQCLAKFTIRQEANYKDLLLIVL